MPKLGAKKLLNNTTTTSDSFFEEDPSDWQDDIDDLDELMLEDGDYGPIIGGANIKYGKSRVFGINSYNPNSTSDKQQPLSYQHQPSQKYTSIPSNMPPPSFSHRSDPIIQPSFFFGVGSKKKTCLIYVVGVFIVIFSIVSYLGKDDDYYNYPNNKIQESSSHIDDINDDQFSFTSIVSTTHSNFPIDKINDDVKFDGDDSNRKSNSMNSDEDDYKDFGENDYYYDDILNSQSIGLGDLDSINVMNDADSTNAFNTEFDGDFTQLSEEDYDHDITKDSADTNLTEHEHHNDSDSVSFSTNGTDVDLNAMSHASGEHFSNTTDIGLGVIVNNTQPLLNFSDFDDDTSVYTTISSNLNLGFVDVNEKDSVGIATGNKPDSINEGGDQINKNAINLKSDHVSNTTTTSTKVITDKSVLTMDMDSESSGSSDLGNGLQEGDNETISIIAPFDITEIDFVNDTIHANMTSSKSLDDDYDIIFDHDSVHGGLNVDNGNESQEHATKEDDVFKDEFNNADFDELDGDYDISTDRPQDDKLYLNMSELVKYGEEDVITNEEADIMNGYNSQENVTNSATTTGHLEFSVAEQENKIDEVGGVTYHDTDLMGLDLEVEETMEMNESMETEDVPHYLK